MTGLSYKMPHAGRGLKQQRFISRFWEEAGKLKIKVSADLVPGERSLPSLDILSMSTRKCAYGPSSVCMHGERAWALWCLFLQEHQSSWIRTPALCPHLILIISVNALSLYIQLHWMEGLQHINFGGEATIQSLTDGELCPTDSEPWRSVTIQLEIFISLGPHTEKWKCARQTRLRKRRGIEVILSK